MAGATVRIADATVGLAYYTPFGGVSSWDQRSAFDGNTVAPGAVDGVQRWYSIEGELRASVLSLGAAVDLGALDVDVSANLMQTAFPRHDRRKHPSGPPRPERRHLPLARARARVGGRVLAAAGRAERQRGRRFLSTESKVWTSTHK
jgi:hypothetical protein